MAAITAAEALELSSKFAGEVSDEALTWVYQKIGRATDRGDTYVEIDQIRYRGMKTADNGRVQSALEADGYTYTESGGVTTISWAVPVQTR